jgi:formamidopyrimidine-DNA glycosylase
MRSGEISKMPELPEVEIFKRYFDSHALNQRIIECKVIDARILNTPEKEFKSTIMGKKFNSTIRHGKYLIVALNSIQLIMHFGMTGDLHYFNVNEPTPSYSKVLFFFDNGHVLSYISMRMFGKLEIAESMEKFLKLKKLGPDAYLMNREEFTKTIKRRSTIMKSALLDQGIFAGIGNIYSDEILWRSRIHPKRKINSLDEKELELLFKSIKDVLQYGIDHVGDLETYSIEMLIPHRDKNTTCPRCGTNIERYEISGRHGFFCPKCQS